MSSREQLRRRLYEQLSRNVRGRRVLRRQIAVLAGPRRGDGPTDEGSAGVREPRRPVPSGGTGSASLEQPVREGRDA